MKLFPTAHIHHIMFQINEVIFGEMMFVSGKGIAGTLHKVLALHVIFSKTVNHDMHMNVGRSIYRNLYETKDYAFFSRPRPYAAR